MKIADQRGIVLLWVCVALAIVAAAAFTVNREVLMGMSAVNTQIEREKARYLAEAGISHAKWVAQNQSCNATTYPAVAASLDGMGSYAAVTTRGLDKKELTIVVNATSSKGARASLTRAGIARREPVSPSSVRTDELAAARDTSLRQDLPALNFGGVATLELGRNSGHALLDFDMPGSMKGGSILSAKLTLYQSARTGTGAVGVYDVRAAWDESQAAWTVAKSDTPWKSAGGDYGPGALAMIPVASASGFYTWDVTAIADAWLHDAAAPYGLAKRGLLLRAEGSLDGAVFHSRENTVNVPKLVLEYVKAC
jgi:hypothetical protein